MKKYILIPCLLLAVAQARSADNLLQNGDFESSDAKRVPGWIFLLSHLPEDTIDADQVVWESVAEGNGNLCLKLGVLAPVKKLHVFWVQSNLPVAPGGSYRLSFRARGAFSKQTSTDFGAPTPDVMFLDADSQWIGSIPVPDVTFTNEWKTHEFSFTAPENAALMGVRFGLVCQGGVGEILVDDVVLKEGAQ